jgi:Fe2+ transport system protein FeoA
MSTPVQTLDPVITCVACGLTYSVSQGRDSCDHCPLHTDCSTSCCPNCGTSNINPDQSRLARWVQRLFVRHPEPVPELAEGPGLRRAQPPVEGRTLAGVKPGREVSVTGYSGLSGGQRQHLQAYGLLPGRRVRVIAQRPVTIVQVEETELAFEGGIAAGVLVGD